MLNPKMRRASHVVNHFHISFSFSFVDRLVSFCSIVMFVMQISIDTDGCCHVRSGTPNE